MSVSFWTLDEIPGEGPGTQAPGATAPADRRVVGGRVPLRRQARAAAPAGAATPPDAETAVVPSAVAMLVTAASSLITP